GVVAAHVRTRAQVQRFLWAVVASAVLVSLYGISQHFGVDLMRTGGGPVRRASLSFGNPIFAGSFLVLTIPLTMALVMSLKDKTDRAEHILLGATLIAPQIAAMAFTLSRGPWVGLIAGMGALVVLLYWMGGLAVARRGLVILASAGAIAFLLVLLPVPGAASGSGVGDVGERLGGIPAGVAGGMTHRWTTWTTAAEAFVTVPWVDTAEYPEFPELGFRPLRPLVGYGPDMFGYAYPLAGEQTYTFEISTHGHNFLVHTALELGLLGVAAYVFLAVAIGLALLRLLRAARVRNGDLLYLMLLVGLGAAFVGRVVEQIPGKAQVSDLMLAWVLAGLVVALTTF
ncbi:MAG: O-antigen ligase family protein, partial [Dehalococcoidia bacterium]